MNTRIGHHLWAGGNQSEDEADCAGLVSMWRQIWDCVRRAWWVSKPGRASVREAVHKMNSDQETKEGRISGLNC